MSEWNLEKTIAEVFAGRESEIDLDYCVMCARGGRYQGCECRYFRNGKFTVGFHGADSRFCPVCMITQPSVAQNIAKFILRLSAEMIRDGLSFPSEKFYRAAELAEIANSILGRIPREIRKSEISTKDCHFDTGLNKKQIADGIRIALRLLCALRDEGYPIDLSAEISKIELFLKGIDHE